MISIIVCSINQLQYVAFCHNLQETIGVPYEVIKINKPHSICFGYNSGATKAKYDILCFSHEDIIFRTNNWGVELIKHFESDRNIGLIGVAGSIYHTKMVSWWYNCKIPEIETLRMNTIMHYKYSQNKSLEHLFKNPNKEAVSEVVTLDGLFLATTKQIWQMNKFDEKRLSSFHGYDIDFSLNIGTSKKVVVVYNILIEHLSEGVFGGECLLAYIKIHKKWKNSLPRIITHQSINEKYEYHRQIKNLQTFTELLINSDYSFFFVQYYFFSMLRLITYKPSLKKFFDDAWHSFVFCLKTYCLKKYKKS